MGEISIDFSNYVRRVYLFYRFVIQLLNESLLFYYSSILQFWVLHGRTNINNVRVMRNVTVNVVTEATRDNRDDVIKKVNTPIFKYNRYLNTLND